MTWRPRRRGLSTIELLIALVISTIVVGVVFGFFRFARVSTERTVGPQLALGEASRQALLELIRELQEAIEVNRPIQGSTLTYFVVRDKLNQVLVGYLVTNPQAKTQDGRPLFDLILDRTSFGGPSTPKKKKLLSNLERFTVTGLSPALIQIHADFHEQGRSFAFFTTIRARNVFSDNDL